MKSFVRFMVRTSALALVLMIPTHVHAQEDEQGGPCGGASAPSQKVHVHVVGQKSRQSMKLIGHFESDYAGDVVGELIVGRGKDHLVVTNWCRVWTSHETTSGHSSVLHVLGTVSSLDGRAMYVRVDLRSEEGGKVRVRVREKSGHDVHTAKDSATDEHGSWTSITGEGWLSTTRLRLNKWWV